MKRNIVLNAMRLHAPAGFEFKAVSRPARNVLKFVSFGKPAEKVNRQVVIENPVLNSPFRAPIGQIRRSSTGADEPYHKHKRTKGP